MKPHWAVLFLFFVMAIGDPLPAGAQDITCRDFFLAENLHRAHLTLATLRAEEGPTIGLSESEVIQERLTAIQHLLAVQVNRSLQRERGCEEYPRPLNLEVYRERAEECIAAQEAARNGEAVARDDEGKILDCKIETWPPVRRR